jgi:membrane peptidoglycan carboxypeptidase
MNLFGNAASTNVADNVRRQTGSSMGYFAKYAAGGNGGQALYNTTQAGYYAYDLYHPCIYDQMYYDILPPYRAMGVLNASMRYGYWC